jgi:hypothetical protein
MAGSAVAVVAGAAAASGGERAAADQRERQDEKLFAANPVVIHVQSPGSNKPGQDRE